MFNAASVFNQSLGVWVLNPTANMSNMLDFSGMNCKNYSKTLKNWAVNPPSGRFLGAQGLQYGMDAYSSRVELTTVKGWTIVGDVLVAGNCIPLINVKGNNVVISNGDNSPSLTDHTDMGTNLPGSSNVRTFTIQNPSTTSLTVSSITPSNPLNFFISGITLPIVIPAGGTTTFTITCATNDIVYSTITINNDGLNNETYTFDVVSDIRFITIANGDWTNPSTWNGGLIPASNGRSVIAHAVNLNTNYNLGPYSLEILNNKSLNIKNTRTLTVPVAGSINNHGILISNIGGALLNNGIINNFGILHCWETFTNNLTLNNNGILNNTKNLINSVSGTILNQGIINNNSGGTLNNNGSFDNNLGVYNNNFGSILSGAGTYLGYLANDGTFAPGNSPGVFTINGTFVNNGQINIEIGGDNGPGDPNGHDLIVVNGDVILGGTINIILINFFTPTTISTYNFINATTVNNTFTIENLPSMGWTIPYGATFAQAKYEEVLPVNLISFTGSRTSNENVSLNWNVSSENNLQNYEVERKLDSQNLFTKVSTVDEIGFSNYIINDFNNHSNVSYYRLKMNNLDGSFKYSNIVSVDASKILTVSIYPNPSTGLFNIQFESDESSIVDIKVLDLQGKKLIEKSVDLSLNKLITLDLKNLSKGVYILSLYSNSTEFKHKLIIE